MTFKDELKIPSYWKQILTGLIIIEVLFFLLSLFQPIFAVLGVLCVIGFGLFYILFLRSPFIWICLLIFASSLETYGRIGGGITLFHVVYLVSFLAFLSYLLFTQSIGNLKLRSPINKLVLLYLLISFISLLYSPNLESGIQNLAATFALFLFFLMIINFVNKSFHYTIITFVLILTNIFITTLIIYQTLKGEYIPGIMDSTVSVAGIKFYRAVGTFQDPNVAAAYLVAGIILAFARLIHAKDSIILKTYFVFGLVISTVGVLITFSRSALIFQFIGMLVVLLFIKNKVLLLSIALIILLVIISVGILSPFGILISERVSTIFELLNDSSIKVRILMAISGFHMFLDSPIWGIGYRGFPILYDYYVQPNLDQNLLYIKECHTLFVTILAELGIVGFSVVFLWFRKVIINCYNAIKIEENNFRKPVLIGSYSLFIGFMINFLFYGTLFPLFNLFWLNLGLIFSVTLNSDSIQN